MFISMALEYSVGCAWIRNGRNPRGDVSFLGDGSDGSDLGQFVRASVERTLVAHLSQNMILCVSETWNTSRRASINDGDRSGQDTTGVHMAPNFR